MTEIPVGENLSKTDILKGIVTPYERGGPEHVMARDSRYASDEAQAVIAIEKAWKSNERKSAFAELARRERGENSGWQGARAALDWYSIRDTWTECGNVGSFVLHNSLMKAHAWEIVRSGPLIEKFNAIADILDARQTDIVRLLTKP